MIGLPSSSLQARIPSAASLPSPILALPTRWSLPAIAVLLTLGPVFLQAPLVRSAPMAATLGTIPLLLIALALARQADPGRQRFGVLLVGFAGSWLGGSLFWGWAREYPFWHLPIEAFALPLAIGGLRTRWRLGAWFYLASLLGTAATDGVIALTGLMPLWPPVVVASAAEAADLLREAAQRLLHPSPLFTLAVASGWILLLARRFQIGDEGQRVAAATLASTLIVDGLFLGVALLAPHLSGLI